MASTVSTAKEYKAVKLALDSKNSINNCMQGQPHVPIMEDFRYRTRAKDSEDEEKNYGFWLLI